MSERCEILYCLNPQRFEKYCLRHQYEICRNGLRPTWAVEIMKSSLWAKFLFCYVCGDRARTPEYERELRVVFEEQYLPSFSESTSDADHATPSAGDAKTHGDGEGGEGSA